MTIESLVVFAVALFVAAASPGPGIAAIVARVLGRGTAGALAFTVGIAMGDVVWLTVAVTGLAALANTFHGVFTVVKYVGAAYLLFIAWKLWTAPALAHELRAQMPAEPPLKLFLAGLSVTMGNPKVMVFYLALLPSIIDMQAMDGLGYVELVAVTALVLAAVFGGYVLLAARARRLFTSASAIRVVNRTSGAVMAGAAAAIVAR